MVLIEFNCVFLAEGKHLLILYGEKDRLILYGGKHGLICMEENTCSFCMEEKTGSFCMESCGRGSAARGESEATADETRACSQHGDWQ